jgi:hypothetical protein
METSTQSATSYLTDPEDVELATAEVDDDDEATARL